MSEDFIHPAEREAERLRVIIQTLAEASPDMTMFAAAPTIFEIERKTAELEKVQFDQRLAAMRTPPACTLPDSSPETTAKFVDLCQEIKDFMPHKKINAIKELRARTGLGLKEAKDGIEYWERYYPLPAAPAAPPKSSSGTTRTPTPVAIADWIDTLGPGHSVMPHMEDAYKGVAHAKLKAIKEVRYTCPMAPGLKEAKEGVEEWLRRKSPLPF